jgi:hypothetical protein
MSRAGRKGAKTQKAWIGTSGAEEVRTYTSRRDVCGIGGATAWLSTI